MKKTFTQTLLTILVFVSLSSYLKAQTYCSPSYIYTCCMGFSNVQFGSINNNSSWGNGYEDYTSTVSSAAVIKGANYNLTFYLEDYDQYVYAWIDFNADGDFVDAGENVVATSSYLYPYSQYSYSVNIPTTAATGTTRLRLSGQYYYYSPNSNPCGSFYYGDVEDYNIYIVAPSPMTIDSVKTFTLDTNNVFIGLNYAKMISANLYVGGNLSPKVLEKVYFSTSPSTSAADISRVALFQNNNFPWQESDTFSTPVISPNGTFSFNIYRTLQPGTLKLYLGYDVSPDAVENNYLDARFDSVLISGVMYYPSITSPAGARKIVTQANYNGYCTLNRYVSGNYAVGTIRVKFAGIDQISGTPAGAPAYTFYPTPVPTVYIQKTYPLSISQGTFQSSNSAAVYIDWNNNGYFDANEKIINFLGQPASTTNTYNLTIPCGTSPGVHRMRITSDMGWYDPPGCGTTWYGECEDYLFNVPKQVAPVVSFTANDTNYVGGFSQMTPTTTIDGDLVYQWDIDDNSTIEDSTDTDKPIYSYRFSTAGSIPVALTAKLYGCDSIYTSAKYVDNVLVVNPTAPKVNFIASLNSVTPQISTTLSDLTTQGPFQWKWKITPAEIDGVPTYTITPNDTTQNVSVKFQKLGQYSVTLVATNAVKKDSASKVNYITVSSPQLMCSNTTKSTEKSGYLYDDGGKYSNYAEATTYPSQYCSYLIQPKCAAGVTLSVMEMDINSYNSTGCININHADYLAVYDGTSKSGKALHLGIVDMYNNPVYPFGLQNGANNMQRTPPYPTFSGTSGSLFIEFGKNCNGVGAGFEAKWTTQLLTPSVAPVAAFNIPDTAYLYQTLKFDGTQSTGYELEYAWDMNGDGLTDDVKAVSYYTFTQAGKYVVSLSANSCALSDKKYDTILVLEPVFKPVANFAAEFTKISSSDILNIFDKSSPSVYNWKWTITPSTFKYVNETAYNTKDLALQFTAPGMYTVKLVVTNSKGMDSITKTNYIQVYTICEPSVFVFNADLGIAEVKMTDANGNELINQASNIGVSGYTNYANIHKPVVYSKGKYTIKLIRNTNFNKTTRTVWIDYNQDGTFSSSEIVLNDTNSQIFEVIKTITIPATALYGKARMRIAANAGVLANKPCGANYTGEFEDYSVDIQPDLIKPVITLDGGDTVKINSCDNFTEPGYVAKDNCDGIITHKVTRIGNILNTVQGFYQLTYSVTDTNGNTGTKIRIVEVLRDLIPPVLTLRGSANITQSVYTPYKSMGYTVTDNCSGVNKVDSTGTTTNPNINKLGVYTVKYTASDKAVPPNYTYVTKTVTVVDDIVPSISLIGSDTVFVDVFSVFNDPGVVITDNYNTGLAPNIADNINTSKIGTYFRTYCVSDSSGNGPVCIDRVIMVQDKTAPTISLIGDDTITVDVNDNYSEPGCNYSDNYWPNSSLTLVISGTVNSYILGNYLLSYKIYDGSGNVSAILYRTVKVVDNIEPEISLVGPTTVVLTRWEEYVDEGVVVIDNYYKASTLTVKYNETGTFQNTLWPGLYSYSYSVCDPSGNCSKDISRNIYVIESTSSIAEESISKYIKYYPNPVSTEMNINIDLPVTSDVVISIYNTLGEKVMDVYKGRVKNELLKVNTQGLSSGIYYLRIDVDNIDQVNKKFIITK